MLGVLNVTDKSKEQQEQEQEQIEDGGKKGRKAAEDKRVPLTRVPVLVLVTTTFLPRWTYSTRDVIALGP